LAPSLFEQMERILPLALRHSAWRASATALCALGLVVPALSGPVLPPGDGSATDNERLVPHIYPAAPVPTDAGDVNEPYHPYFDIDWSLALRGAYTKGTRGERFDTFLVPEFALDHVGTRSAATITGRAETVRPTEGKIDVTGLRLGLTAGYALDSVTDLTATGSLTFSQALSGTPGVASDVAVPAENISGDIALGVTRQFGRFNVGLSGSAERNLYGPATLIDGTVNDNSVQNHWALDSGLRVGFQTTPIFEVFGQAGYGRDLFDETSSAGLTQNATDTQIEGGITGRWNSTLEATASTGLALRRFDNASLGEVTTQLYDASITFTPDPTWRMRAAFTTEVAPPGPNNPGTTRVEQNASAELGYTVNSWLALRALASWSSARFIGSSETETSHGVGAGADYAVNAHTAVTADYLYDRVDSTSTGREDSHQVTLGVTLSR
jgi:hypothetical protein